MAFNKAKTGHAVDASLAFAFLKQNKMITTGIKGHAEITVSDDLTAANVGSGLARVFSTPMLIALMERCCSESVAQYLNEGDSTVGTHLDVSHSAATPVGMRVWCESELMEVDRRRLVFRVQAFDDCGPVGEGTHERFIVNNVKFQAKADAKRQ